MTNEYIRYHGNLYYRHYGKERMEQIFISGPNGIMELAKERAKTKNITSLTIVVSHYSEATNVNTYNEWHFYDYDKQTGEFTLKNKTTDEP